MLKPAEVKTDSRSFSSEGLIIAAATAKWRSSSSREKQMTVFAQVEDPLLWLLMWKNILRFTEAAQEKKNVADDSLLQQQKWKKDDKTAVLEKSYDSSGPQVYISEEKPHMQCRRQTTERGGAPREI